MFSLFPPNVRIEFTLPLNNVKIVFSIKASACVFSLFSLSLQLELTQSITCISFLLYSLNPLCIQLEFNQPLINIKTLFSSCQFLVDGVFCCLKWLSILLPRPTAVGNIQAYNQWTVRILKYKSFIKRLNSDSCQMKYFTK